MQNHSLSNQRKFLWKFPEENLEDKPSDMPYASSFTSILPAVKSFSWSHVFHECWPTHSPLSVCCFDFFLDLLTTSSWCLCTNVLDHFALLYLSTKSASALDFLLSSSLLVQWPHCMLPNTGWKEGKIINQTILNESDTYSIFAFWALSLGVSVQTLVSPLTSFVPRLNWIDCIDTPPGFLSGGSVVIHSSLFGSTLTSVCARSSSSHSMDIPASNRCRHWETRSSFHVTRFGDESSLEEWESS